MDHGHGQHVYQGGVSYSVDDDMLNNAGWPSSADQYVFQDAHPSQHHSQQQDQYAQYAASQSNFDHHFDITHQPAYQQTPYTQSPYAPQYQHARPADVFAPSPYDFDSHAPSLQQRPNNAYSSNHGNQSFSYGTPPPNNTITPQSLHHYNMSQVQSVNGATHPGFHQFNQSQIPAQDHSARYFVEAPVPTPTPTPIPQQQQQQQQPQPQTQPQQQQSTSNGRQNQITAPVRNDQVPENGSQLYVTHKQPIQRPNPLRITHPELLAEVENAPQRQLKYAPFVALGETVVQIPSSEREKLKNAIPKYHPRKSISGKALVPGLDMSSTVGQPRTSTTKKVKTPKVRKVHESKWKGTSQGAKQAISAAAKPRSEGTDLNATAKSPSASTETSSSEESSSEEESDYEEEATMVTFIEDVRGATRPTDVAAAAGWDAVGIVWKDPGSSPGPDVVKEAIQKYGDFVSSLRLQLKANAEEIKKAEARPADVEKLKKARKVHFDSMFETIDAANRLGYMAIIENLGGHHKLVNGLTATLIDCIKTEDFLGRLPRAIFSLLAKFQTMSDELLKKVKFDSIQKRWNKKGDESIKKDIAAIIANTTDSKEKATKDKKEGGKVEEKKRIQAPQDKSRAGEPGKAVSTSNSTKRPHDGDGVNGQPSKKLASDASGTSGPSTKSMPIKRSTNLLANLLGSKPAAKPVVKKRDPSPPPVSRLMGFLAEIENPQKPPKAPEPPAGPPETPEEKKIRERKESRRHLRVKFKEGAELEQVRLFTKEQAEDEGRQDAMLRDAHDAHSEGMMLKMGSDSMEGMEEDDEQPTGEIELRPYSQVTDIDFSGLPKEVLSRNLVTRGGSKVFSTAEQQAQERREELELMVFYTDPKDIPTSPKEPQPTAGAVDKRDLRQLGTPNATWLTQRLQELQSYGLEYATQLFSRRFEQSARASNNSFSSPDSRNIMDNRRSLHPPQGDAPADSPSQSSNNRSTSTLGTPMSPRTELAHFNNLKNIVDTVNSLKGKPYPPVEPPDWMTSERDKAIWWDGYHRDEAAKAAKENADRIAQLQLQTTAAAQPAPMVAPQNAMPIPQMQGYGQTPNHMSAANYQTPDVTRQVTSILADLNNGQNGGNSYGGHSAAPAHFDYTSWSNSSSGGNRNGNGSSNSQFQGYGDEDYQQPRWDGQKRRNDDEHDNPPSKRSKNRGSAKQREVPENDAAVRAYKGKKKVCRFFQDGKCAKGPNCTFLHE